MAALLPLAWFGLRQGVWAGGRAGLASQQPFKRKKKAPASARCFNPAPRSSAGTSPFRSAPGAPEKANPSAFFALGPFTVFVGKQAPSPKYLPGSSCFSHPQKSTEQDGHTHHLPRKRTQPRPETPGRRCCCPCPSAGRQEGGLAAALEYGKEKQRLRNGFLVV